MISSAASSKGNSKGSSSSSAVGKSTLVEGEEDEDRENPVEATVLFILSVLCSSVLTQY